MNVSEGQKFVKQKEFGKALKIFLYLKEQNDDPRINFYLGLINFELNNFSKSVFYYNKFLKKNQNSLSGLLNLAIVFQTIGKFQKAKDIYFKLLELNKLDVRAYYGLYNLNPKNLTNDLLKNLNKIKIEKKLNLYEEAIISFLLSKKEKENKKYNQEIIFLKKFHESIFNFNYSYNKSSQFYYQRIISKKFDKIIFNKKKFRDKYENNNIQPIFIIGLPRSGSTLVESILTSSKEKITTYGESHVVNMSLLDQIGNIIFKKKFNEKAYEIEVDLENINENILNRYSKYNFEKKKINKFIDKSLENFFNIEIIKKIYPNAKFLHTFRNPVDSAISIYQSMLPDLSWTHSIEDILIYIDNYLKVINFFKKKYPKIIMDINLQELTENNIDFSKNIIKFCNLTWSDQIIKFYKRDDLYSKTLSFTQIRSKVKRYDSKKYYPYFYLLDDYKKKFLWINY